MPCEALDSNLICIATLSRRILIYDSNGTQRNESDRGLTDEIFDHEFGCSFNVIEAAQTIAVALLFPFAIDMCKSD